MNGTPLHRLAWHQSRAALRLPIWRALLLALTVAIAISTALAVLGERLEQSLGRQTAELLGADMTLRSSRPIPTSVSEQAAALGLQTTQAVQFPTMVEAGEQMQLVSLRAVEAPYPLRGRIDTEPAQNDLPQPGTVWAEPAVLERLGLSLGDNLQLGYLTLQISAQILSSPDRGMGFSSLSPQVLIHRSDLDATGLLGPGARVSYRQLFSGDSKALKALETTLRAELTTGQRLTTLDADQNFSGGALNNTARYLRLGALLTLLISALTIALSLRRYTLGTQNRAAVLLSLGMTAGQLQRLFLYQLLIGWTLCAVAGTLVALLLEQAALALLGGLLPQPVPAAPLLLYGSGALLGLLILLTLGLPPMIAMSQVSVMQLFRRISPPDTARGRLLKLIAALLLGLLLMIYLEDLKLTLILIGGLVSLAWVLGRTGTIVLQRISAYLARHHTLGRLLRLRLQQQTRWHHLQIPIISLLLALMAVSLWARSDLLTRWQAQLPANTPNHFLINVQPHEFESVAGTLSGHGVDNTLYPMVRGRLTAFNGVATDEAFEGSQRRHNALNRELNLTWAEALPAHNRLISGSWSIQPSGSHQISVEQEFAQALDLKLGDRLAFTIGSQTVEGQINSIRAVRWESFQPNFYVIFTPGALDNLPATYITSYFVEGAQRSVNRALLQQFPTITLIEIEQLLTQARTLIHKLSDTSGLIMTLTLIAGLILVFTTVSQELDQRRYENALLHTLGATPRQCTQLDLLEFALLGAVCGGMAAALAELALWFIHQQLVLIEPVLHPTNWLLLPLAAALLFTLIGVLAGRRVDERNSYRLLRELR